MTCDARACDASDRVGGAEFPCDRRDRDPGPVGPACGEFLEAEGFTVVDWVALEVGDNAEVGCIPGERVMEAARGLDLAGADALVISACVQMPSLDLVAPAEVELGLPVLSAATAGAYALLTGLGLDPVLPGAGRLLAGGR